MDFDKIYESCKLEENAVAMTPDQLKNYFTLMDSRINYIKEIFQAINGIQKKVENLNPASKQKFEEFKSNLTTIVKAYNDFKKNANKFISGKGDINKLNKKTNNALSNYRNNSKTTKNAGNASQANNADATSETTQQSEATNQGGNQQPTV